MLSGYSPFADHDANEQVSVRDFLASGFWWHFSASLLTRLKIRSLPQVTIYKNILRGSLRFPSALKDVAAKDIIKKLLTANVSQRLGCLRGGAVNVMQHDFFKHVDWSALMLRRIPPPIKPTLKSATVSGGETLLSPLHLLTPCMCLHVLPVLAGH
jgi:serine/threonine protein kinase